jgi:cyclic-di-GMP-binding protein
MLTLISNRFSDHPLDSSQARVMLLKDFANMSALPVLNEICGYLDAIKTADNLKPKRALEIIDFLDSTAAPVVRRLTDDYLLAGPRVTKFRHGSLATASESYWAQLFEAYRVCIASYQMGAPGASPLKPELAKVVCRALRACSAQVTWAFLRRVSVQQHLWRELGKLYQFGESLGLTKSNNSLYGNGQSTIEREFCSSLMLAVSAPDALATRQIQNAADLIAQLRADFRLTRSPEPGSTYVADLTGELPPGRLITAHKDRAHLRYFGPGKAVARVNEIMAFWSQHDAPPGDLHLTRLGDVTGAKATLRHLSRYWDRNPPERKYVRRDYKERITVVHEYEEVLAGVAGLFLDSPFVSNEEQWEIEDVSEAGFGALVLADYGSWIKVGSLIAVQREGGASWAPGVIRRLKLDERENRHVGIELLSTGGSGVTIRAASPITTGNAISRHGELSVLLSLRGANAEEAGLLLRAGQFSDNQSLIAHAYDRRYLLQPIALVEQGEEFDLGRFHISVLAPEALSSDDDEAELVGE